MPVPSNTVVRGVGYAWVGVLIFAVYPATVPGGRAVQAAAYAVAGLAAVGWTIIDHYPPAARRRTRWLPVPLGIIAVAAGCAGPVGWGGLALMIFGFLATMQVARECGLVAALTVALAGVLAAEVTGLIYLRSYGVFSYAAYIGFPVGFLSAFTMGRTVAARTAELLAQREQTEAERRRADLLDERARIAREIHDVLAHSLGALGIQIQAARSVMTDLGDIARADELLAGAEKMAGEGLTETRRALHALRTDMLPLDRELAKAVASYAERYRVAIGDMRTEGSPRPVPPDAAIALLRVAQESVVNAAKHAAGRPVDVCLAYEPDEVRLTVANDLTGETADPAPVSTADTGYGLTGMRERLRLLNGSLETGRRGGQWVVTAELPVPGTMTS